MEYVLTVQPTLCSLWRERIWAPTITTTTSMAKVIIIIRMLKIVLFKSIRNSKRRNKGNFTSKSN